MMKYISDLPQNVIRELCTFMDINDFWISVGLKLELKDLTYMKILELRNENSPSYRMLGILGSHTISELYVAFGLLNHERGLCLLDECVTDEIRNAVRPPSILSTMAQEDAISTPRITQPQQSAIDTLRGNNRRCDDREIQNVSEETKPERYEHKIAVPEAMTCETSVQHRPPVRRANFTDVAQMSTSRAPVTFSQVAYKDLETATHNWDKNHLISETGTTFYGTWKESKVAIKRIDFSDCEKDKVLDELRLLQSMDHRNLLKVRALVEGYEQPCLVYDFVEGHSLAHCFENGLQLSWWNRHRIARGIVEALFFLHKHFSAPSVLKSSDVLLNLDQEPLVGGLCLPAMIPASPKESLARYLPNDFLNSEKSAKEAEIDTFSCGVILLELFSGNLALSKPHQCSDEKVYLKILRKIRKNGTEEDKELSKLLLSWGLFCAVDRTHISKVHQIISKKHKSMQVLASR